MKIIVRKMPNMVLHESYKQIEGLYETCYAGNAMETFLKSLEMSTDDNCLNLEDDTILTEDFLKKVNEIVDTLPDTVIQFFTLRKTIEQTTLMPGGSFSGNVCVYHPKWLNIELLKYYPIWAKTKRNEPGHAYDYMIADYLASKKIPYLIYHPSLVQHMEMVSRIDKRRSSKRQSRSFK